MTLMRFNIIIILLSLLLFRLNLPAQTWPDSVSVPASNEFEKASIFKKIFMGSNYRKEWSTPVAMPIFDLKNDDRVFTIDELGGGNQTTTLYLKDKNGYEWALRSVDKKIKKDLLKGMLQTPLIRDMVQDLVSTAYPYAGLSIPDLSSAVGIPAGSHQLYFVPDDPVYGEFRQDMANRAFILIEMEPTGEDDDKTDKVLKLLAESNQYSIAQQDYLKTRLLDWLLADWDRHADQYRWLKKDSVDKKWIYPFPRDRDQAFANSNGLFVKLVGRTAMPFLRGFDKKSTGIRQISKKIDTIDIAFLNDLDRYEWEEIIKNFQKNISDSVIEMAVKKQPAEIYAIRGEEIIERLRSRRDGLLKNAMKYYSFLAKEVTIKGSGESELFKVINETGMTHVYVYDHSNGDTSAMIYSRTFYPAETRIIYLEENGPDKILQEGSSNKIKIVVKNSGRNQSYILSAKSGIKE